MTDRDASGHRNSWTLNPRRVFGGLSVCVAILLALSLATRLANISAIEALGITRFLDVNGEGNLPATFSGALLAFAAVLLYVIGFTKRAGSTPFSKHWLGLGVMFTYMAIDELAAFHELFISVGLLLRWLGWSGMYQGTFRFPWVIVGVVAVISVGFVFRRFVRSLPRRTGRYFLLAATLFVAGAIGGEMLGSLVWGSAKIYTMAALHIEEGLEMVGVVVFIYALLDYARPFVVSVDGEKKRVEISIGC